ncbi:hypothetical protein M1105_14500 [Limibaculum sp. FT325]|uniref:hypothetical protein n=1 Tax=Thermohalobaculum sediminis TaxID=2939436 RepID=UPI0020BE89DC|nr:hypothetical protein [Limibaculum sediminis]MCL5778191.1 hypothetical protein [Limibaculum sediminis]
MRRGGIAAALGLVALAVFAALPARAGTPSGVTEIAAAFAGPPAAGETRVLFIGNSFTREHDLPELVKGIAAREGVRLRPAMMVRDGAHLAQHAAAPEVARLVADPGWEVLVLQDHSVAALTPESAAASRAAAARLAGLTAARLVLFATWPRAPGHALYAEPGMPDTPARMNARVAAHYAGLAEALGARVAGVGDAFLAVGARASGPGLHATDGYHASPEGARLAASVLAAAILAPPLVPRAERAALSPAPAQPARSIAAR